MAHVINLVAQKILAAAAEMDDPDLHDYYEELKALSVHYDVDDDPEQKDLEAEADTATEGADNTTRNDSDSRMKDMDSDDEILDPEEENGFKSMSPIEKVCDFLFVPDNAILLTIVVCFQLRIVSQKIVGTPGRRSLFREKATKAYGNDTITSAKGRITLKRKLLPVRPVRTRWNSLHATIGRGCLLRKVRYRSSKV